MEREKTLAEIRKEKELEEKGIEIAKRLGEEQARTAGGIERLKKQISNNGDLQIR